MEEDQQSIYEKFTWQIDNFSLLKNKIRSEPFVLCGYPWRINLYPQGSKQVNDLSIYLEAARTANMSEGWSRDSKVRLVMYDQLKSNLLITKEFNHEFNEKEWALGFKSFIPLAELNDPQKGFLVKDACIVGVEVSVSEAKNEKQVGQVAAALTASLSPALLSVEPTQNTDVELFSASIGELMDFRGLGQIEKAFVPLLEEVCTHHPSLIECQKKRSCKFTGWAFNALGRLLYFLKTKKVKDMNDLCCKDLQTLWEELEIFGFDLTWLEPHIQTTLGMKSYVEKVMQVEKLKKNMLALELEMKKLKAELVNLELETMKLDGKRNLLKAKGFQVSDLDAELGYGGWEAKCSYPVEMKKLKAELVNLELETMKLDAKRDLLKAKGFQVSDLDAELGYGCWEA